MIMNFGSMLSGAAALAMVLGCYTVSLKVSGERKAVDDLRAGIARDVRGIRTLQAELRTRARLPELQRWNDEVLALGAPTAAQFVRDPVLLAGYQGQRAPSLARAPMPQTRYATAPEAHTATAPEARYAIAPATPAPIPPVVTVAYALPVSQPVLPRLSASLSLDEAVTGATLERVALR